MLRERGLEVVAIAGTSMGALVGGVAAAGRLDEYTEWSLSLTQRELFRLLDFTLSAPGGAIRAERIIGKVGEILGGATIEDLPIPYTAVATDLAARREVWFQNGPVVQAIRASIAIPGVITPIVINGRTLVDGGLLNPLPIEPTAAVSADVTIAVSLSGPRAAIGHATPVKETSETKPFDEWTSRLRRSTAEVLESERLRALVGRFGAGYRRDETGEGETGETEAAAADETAKLVDEAAEAAGPDLSPTAAAEWVVGKADIGTINLLNMSFETMSALITRYRMASNPPDILITVPYNAVNTLDFHRAAEMIELGRTLTTQALDRAGL